MNKQKKLNVTFSILAFGSGVYFFFCLFFIAAGVFWLRDILGHFSKSERTSAQITQEFARFIEKEKTLQGQSAASSVLVQTLGPSQLSNPFRPAEPSLENEKTSMEKYLENERNRDLAGEVRNCLTGESDPFLLGFLVANKRQSTKLESDMAVSQSALETMRKDPEAFREKIKYSIKAMEDNTQCGQESYLLMNLSRSLFVN